MLDESTKIPGDDDEWVIAIMGYGSFLFRGNEEDAEFMRAGKARWEGSTGMKWRVDDPHYGLEVALAPRHAWRKEATAQALNDALAHPTEVATWRNYGRSETSMDIIAALNTRSASAPSEENTEERGNG